MNEIYKLTYAKGDGIGPEVVGSSIQVLRHALEKEGFESRFDLQEVKVGWESVNAYNDPLTAATLAAIEKSDALILGPLEVGKYPGENGKRSPSGAIRKHFDLYANIRPVKSYSKSNQKPIDVVVVRENTEGFYADRNMVKGSGEFMPTPDIALSVRVVTREKCAKISIAGMEMGMARKKKVTAVHKGNVLKMGEGLFLEEFYKHAASYPEVHAEDRLIDSTAYDLIINPGSFDVIVTTNMYGDILSDEAAAIAGSLGIAPAINYGDGWAMAQAAHGTAPALAGKGLANPISEILSVSMLMEWLGRRHSDDGPAAIGRRIKAAVESCMKTPELLTQDLGGNGDLSSVTNLVIDKI
ncbi:MAG: isocitrate/isopropylmalate family dehydrogenase [Thermoplasmatales archaeon]|nr:isocitrate/isopropylmalate family dehydrogenase [Thermoplasmatales archaeon]